MDVRTHWVKSMQPRASLVLGQNCAFFCSVKNAFAATDQFRVGDALYSNKIGDIAPPSSASVIVSEKSGRNDFDTLIWPPNDHLNWPPY